MNLKLIFIAVSVAATSSCSTTYRSGQTPDDVYYSPARVVEEDYRDDSRDEARRPVYQDRSIRMSVYDPRWRDFNDDYNYRYDPYHYGYSYGYYYNPYYCHYPVYFGNVRIVNPKNATPRMTNLGSYNNPRYLVSNVKTSNGNWVSPPRQYNNRNNNSNFIRRVLSSTSSSDTYSSGNSNRSYSPSSSSSSGSSSGSSAGSSGSPVSRPARGN